MSYKNWKWHQKHYLSQNGWVVSNILDDVTAEKSNNQLYNIVDIGIRSMPGYGKKIKFTRNVGSCYLCSSITTNVHALLPTKNVLKPMEPTSNESVLQLTNIKTHHIIFGDNYIMYLHILY